MEKDNETIYMCYKTYICLVAHENLITNRDIHFFKSKDEIEKYKKDFAEINRIDVELVSVEYSEIDFKLYREFKTKLTKLNKSKFSFNDVLFILIDNSIDYEK